LSESDAFRASGTQTGTAMAGRLLLLPARRNDRHSASRRQMVADDPTGGHARPDVSFKVRIEFGHLTGGRSRSDQSIRA
jgi:hypothetical protein